MKYGIWRHENALGNSAEHTYGLAKHLKRTGDPDPIIYVEEVFQKFFAMCIPGITPSRINFFEYGVTEAMMNKTISKDSNFNDIHMPNVYDVPGMKTYPASWADLSQLPDCTLRFPQERYMNKHHLSEGAIVIQVREANTFWKRIDGANEDPRRFVDIRTFLKVAQYFADKGYQVVRLGDKDQTPFPKHKNILDFALVEGRTMLDDLFLISTCKVFLSCDSGIWPMAGAMKKNLVLSNVVSGIEKPVIVNWLNLLTSKVLFKKKKFFGFQDNSAQELIKAVSGFLTEYSRGA